MGSLSEHRYTPSAPAVPSYQPSLAISQAWDDYVININISLGLFCPPRWQIPIMSRRNHHHLCPEKKAFLS